MAPYSELGAFLESKREDKALDRVQLAKLVGVTGSSICNYELGKKRPGRKTFIVLLKVLEVSEAEICEAIRLSHHALTPEDITGAAVDNISLSYSGGVLDNLPLLELIEKYGIDAITDFFLDRENESLIRLIVEIQCERATPLNKLVLQRLVMMRRITRISLPPETWKNVLSALECETSET